ncbi:hypothetical protein, partial [Pseudomonas folii]|uniref:hypothetical protein n=1 Tax=Pseudomonas folii TaxID=2762593 RepID=UPI001BE4794D
WRRPHAVMSDYGYAERQRGTQWWGKSVLLTFALLSKVRRCKSATNVSLHRKNGYAHKNKRIMDINRTLQERPRTMHLYRLSFANLHC